MRITDEQKERAAFVNLPQFLMAHGFDLKKVGREYVWKDHDSLHIKDNGPGVPPPGNVTLEMIPGKRTERVSTP